MVNKWVSHTNRRDVSGRPFCFSETNRNNKQQSDPLANLLKAAIYHRHRGSVCWLMGPFLTKEKPL